MKTHQDPWTIISWVLPAARCKSTAQPIIGIHWPIIGISWITMSWKRSQILFRKVLPSLRTNHLNIGSPAIFVLSVCLCAKRFQMLMKIFEPSWKGSPVDLRGFFAFSRELAGSRQRPVFWCQGENVFFRDIEKTWVLGMLPSIISSAMALASYLPLPLTSFCNKVYFLLQMTQDWSLKI